MTVLDTKIGPKVVAVLAKFGVQAQVTVPSIRVYDAGSGAVDQLPPTVYEVLVTPPDQYDQQWIDGDLIRQDDASVMLAGLGLPFVPDQGLIFSIGGVRWTSVSVRRIQSGDDVAAYEVQLRR